MKYIANHKPLFGRGLFALLTSVLILSGCGSSVTDTPTSTSAAAAATGINGDPFTTGTGTATPTPIPSLPNPATAYFVIQGSTNAELQNGTGHVGMFGPTTTPMSQKTANLSLNTDNQLIVRVISGEANGLAYLGNNTAPTYDCIDYTVNVNGYSYQTNYLAVGGGVGGNNYCGASSTSEDLDFSSCIAGRGSSGPVTIQVTAAQTDTRCEPGGLLYVYGLCDPVENLYWDYYAAGAVQVQVNGTQLSTATSSAGVIKVCP